MDLAGHAAELTEKAAALFKGSVITGMASMGIGGLLQIVLTVVSIAVGIMAFKNYRLSIEIKKIELAKSRGKNRPTEVRKIG